MKEMKRIITLMFIFISCISALVYAAEYDPAILEEFETKEEVGIIVKVIDTSGIEVSSKGSPEQQMDRDLERKEIFEDKVDAILAELSESEFEFGGTFILGNGFYGSVNRDGFNRLVEHPYVKSIYLEGYTYAEDIIFEEDGLGENETVSVEVFPKGLSEEDSLLFDNISFEDNYEEPKKEETNVESLFSRIIRFFKSLFSGQE